ncbi:MAG: histidine phosphatase family protein [Clostridia bacterium]|nr:histidine phosphatase family protein [Clostridia bacterium]
MLFFYIRHGDPIYDPDSLTPLGRRQAEAVAKRLALYGIDRIYASTSDRAIETAKPTCEILKKEMTLVDFANEGHAWHEFAKPYKDGRRWPFHHPDIKPILAKSSVLTLGKNWYTHPELEKYGFKDGAERVRRESDAFFAELGYDHVPDSNSYKITRKNDERVALFAHQGFGLIFLSTLLDIPYPVFSTHFDMGHTGMTVIEFKEDLPGYSIPRVLTLANDSHLYREGLPTKFHNQLYF